MPIHTSDDNKHGGTNVVKCPLNHPWPWVLLPLLPSGISIETEIFEEYTTIVLEQEYTLVLPNLMCLLDFAYCELHWICLSVA